jgi:hypothetical protein
MSRPKTVVKERQFREWFEQTLTTAEAEAAGQAYRLVLAAEVRRNELGLSYAEVARRMGVSRAYVSKLFAGNENSTLLSLNKLAQVLELKLTVDFLSPSFASAQRVGKRPKSRAA